MWEVSVGTRLLFYHFERKYTKRKRDRKEWKVFRAEDS